MNKKRNWLKSSHKARQERATGTAGGKKKIQKAKDRPKYIPPPGKR
jgi:hypothetical protein